MKNYIKNELIELDHHTFRVVRKPNDKGIYISEFEIHLDTDNMHPYMPFKDDWLTLKSTRLFVWDDLGHSDMIRGYINHCKQFFTDSTMVTACCYGIDLSRFTPPNLVMSVAVGAMAVLYAPLGLQDMLSGCLNNAKAHVGSIKLTDGNVDIDTPDEATD